MGDIFLSYCREDDDEVRTIHQALTVAGKIVWRDKEKLKGGVLWPVILGEAIRDHDFFVLCWSKNADQSKFVELEWSTAFALGKQIIPYRLDKEDNTPVPPFLAGLQEVDNTYDLLMAVSQPVPKEDKKKQESTLNLIRDAKTEDPVELARIVRGENKRAQSALIAGVFTIFIMIAGLAVDEIGRFGPIGPNNVARTVFGSDGIPIYGGPHTSGKYPFSVNLQDIGDEGSSVPRMANFYLID